MWCPCGSLDALIDAKGQKTSWQRDTQGRVTAEVRADGTTTTSYTYETTTSRLKTVTDPKHQVTTYTYAGDDAVLSQVYTNAQIATPSASYTYDPTYARVSTMVDGTGTTSYTYHPTGTLGAGQLATEDGPLTNDTIAYTYDQLGRVVQRTINGAVNSQTMVYDALGRVTSETNVLGTFTYGYDGVTSRLASVTYPNGQTSAYSYFPTAQDHRLQTLHHKYPGGATLSKFDYTYDVAGNILTWQQQADSDPPVVWEYGYDPADQLTRAVKKTTGATPTVLKRYAYGYDPAGNRLFEQIDDAVTGWTYDSLNRLVTQYGGGSLRFAGTVSEPATVTVGGQPAAVSAANEFARNVPVVTGTNTVAITATDPSGNVATATYQVNVAASVKAFTYEANGNLTSDGMRTFEWDAANRLTKLIAGTSTYEYGYYGTHQRFQRVHSDGTATTSVRYLWCGAALCEQRDSSSGGVVAKTTPMGWADSQVFFFTTDHLTSVRDVTAANGSVIDRSDYGPWGDKSGAMPAGLIFGFASSVAEADATLALTHFRVYEARLGRWLTRDPLGDADGPNVYTYVANNPIRWNDPTGLQRAAAAGLRPGSNTVVCDGNGNLTVQLDDIGPPEVARCIAFCTLVHEARHIVDLAVATPGVCAGQPRGIAVAFVGPTAEHDGIASERAACEVGLECLRYEMRRDRCGCGPTIRQYYERTALPYCLRFGAR